MTEKRFRYDWKTGRFKDTLSNSCATSNMRVLETQINNACFNYEKKIKKLEKENKELKVTEGEMEDYLARMEEENKELQERNNRQAKQLDNLYTLIEKQDWITLKGLIQEFQECEEQLQKEWGTYGDLE